MNLLWSMGRNLTHFLPDVLESLLSKIVGPLINDLDRIIKGGKESNLVSYIPNLVWCCRVMMIKDEPLW